MTASKEKSIFIYTPNLLNTSQNAMMTGALKKVKEELLESIKEVIGKNNDLDLSINNLKIKSEEKDSSLLENDLEINAKIFFLDSTEQPKGEYIEEAVRCFLESLGVDQIDSLFVAFNGLYLQEDENVTLNNFNFDNASSIWKFMEKEVEMNRVKTIGISEFSKTLLERLYENSKIKPFANQVNLTDCCVIPKDLREYAKGKEIKLLTHIDPSDLLPINDFNNILMGSALDKFNFLPKWGIRYTVMLKSRGIAASKGYIIKAVSTI